MTTEGRQEKVIDNQPKLRRKLKYNKMSSERVKCFASCSLASGRTQIIAKEKMLLETSGDWLHMANLQPHAASVTFTNQWECLPSNSTGSLVKVAGVGHTDETFQDVRKECRWRTLTPTRSFMSLPIYFILNCQLAELTLILITGGLHPSQEK